MSFKFTQCDHKAPYPSPLYISETMSCCIAETDLQLLTLLLRILGAVVRGLHLLPQETGGNRVDTFFYRIRFWVLLKYCQYSLKSPYPSVFKNLLVIGCGEFHQGLDNCSQSTDLCSLNLYFCPAIHILLRGQSFLQGTKDAPCVVWTGNGEASKMAGVLASCNQITVGRNKETS